MFCFTGIVINLIGLTKEMGKKILFKQIDYLF